MSQAAEYFNELLNSGIQKNLYSGAQLYISDPNACLINLSVGETIIQDKSVPYKCRPTQVTENTLFDIASLTKPIAAASLIIAAIDAQLLDLDDKLISVPYIQLPSWLLGNTFADLLCHATRLPALCDLHGSEPNCVSHDLACTHAATAISKLPPRNDASSWCYSDIGYILLGFIIEQCFNMQLNQAFDKLIAHPMGLYGKIMYTPLHSVEQKFIAATSRYMGCFLQGHPDDANARALTHMAGHAGLFASAKAVDTFARSLLSGGFPASAQTVNTFLSFKSELSPFALGWDRPTSNDSLSARKPGDPVLGHLGFTGCSIWMDTDTGRIVTLLTNRAHLNNNPQSINDLRRAIYAAAWNL